MILVGVFGSTQNFCLTDSFPSGICRNIYYVDVLMKSFAILIRGPYPDICNKDFSLRFPNSLSSVLMLVTEYVAPLSINTSRVTPLMAVLYIGTL